MIQTPSEHPSTAGQVDIRVVAINATTGHPLSEPCAPHLWQRELQFTAGTESGRALLAEVMLKDFEHDGLWNTQWNGRSGRLPLDDLDFLMPVLNCPDLIVAWPDGVVTGTAD
jgi:hypothetical protein